MGVRGNKPLEKGGRYYWEIVTRAYDGLINIWVGISTRKYPLTKSENGFVNVLGGDDQSWGLSALGWIEHNGESKPYTQAFWWCGGRNKTIVIGVLFDSNKGTLTYYKNGGCLGVAFSGLHKVKEELFPTVCSSAAETTISLKTSLKDFTDLQDRCRAVILSNLRNKKAIDSLPLPDALKGYIKTEYDFA